MATNDSDAPGVGALVDDAQSMTASPLLYIGALTVAVGHEIVSWFPLSETGAVLALVPVVLVLLYGQLIALAALRRRGYGSGC